jgi:hypothetical protein
MFTKKLIEQFVAVPERRVLVTSDASGSYTYHLAVYEQDVSVVSSLGIASIYLPDVSESAGLFYAIEARTGNTQTVTVKEKSSGNSLDWPGDASLNAAYDRGLWFSDGAKWWLITDQFT